MPITATATVLGFCGVIYELVFAQTLSILFGQSVVQYSLTIGLFLAGMGLGSQLSESWDRPVVQLWRIQLLLSCLTPALLIMVWWLASGGAHWGARLPAYVMCFGIGAITGAELPLLIRLGSGTARTGWILAADYFGMLAACVVFPLVLLPMSGVFTTLFVAALLNSFVMMGMRLDAGRVRMTALVPILLLVAVIFESDVREWLSQRLIAG